MKVKTYSDPRIYFEKVEPFLMKQEAMNNLPLGVTDRLRSQSASADLITVETGGEVVYTLLHTMRNQWVLPAADVDDSFIGAAADYLYQNKYSVDGIVGEKVGAERFLAAYSSISKRKSRVHMNQLVYRLDKLQPIQIEEGRLEIAGESDKPLIADWMYQFGVETGELSIKEDAEELVVRMVDAGSMYLWVVGGEPVSMVNQSRSTKNGATVNAVYTPDQYKRNGYATKAVWSLTKKLLEEGYQFCSLYTDADNPVSNSIYKKIGYFPIGESIVYRFPPNT